MINNVIINGGKPTNVLTIKSDQENATYSISLNGQTYASTTDSSKHIFFTNLSTGTWTITGTKSGFSTCSTTITINSTQSAYYIELFFARYLYNGDYGEAGANGANLCAEYSYGWNATTYASDSISINTNGSAHLFNGTTSSGTQAAILAETINLEDYHTLYITCSCSRIDTSKTWYIRYPDLNVNGVYYKWIGTALATVELTQTAKHTVSIDISHLSQRNVIINFECSYNMITLYKMWLE